MAQLFRALAIVAEDLGLVSSTHVLTYNHQELQFPGHLSSSFGTRHSHDAHTQMQANYSYKQK